jgi:hypothetical protein
VFRFSKLRTTIAILAAASSVAAATGPITTAASAKDNGGAPLDHESLCKSLQNSYNDLKLIATVASEQGDRATFFQAQRDMKSVRDAAYAEKCGWAARVAKQPGISNAVQTARPSAK